MGEVVFAEALFSASASMLVGGFFIILHAPLQSGCNVLVASLSFQFPAIDGFGTGFLIFKVIFFLSFSGPMESLTALVSSSPALGKAAVAVVR